MGWHYIKLSHSVVSLTLPPIGEGEGAGEETKNISDYSLSHLKNIIFFCLIESNTSMLTKW